VLYSRLRRLASRHAEGAALIERGAVITYGQLLARVDATADHLEHDRGLRAGDLVLLASPNRSEWVVLFFALARIGAVTVPLNPGLRDVEVADYLRRFDLRAVAMAASQRGAWKSVLAAAPALDWIDLDDLPDGGGQSTRSLSSSRHQVQGAAIYLSTSGSTGRPRVMARSQRGITVGLESITQRLGLGAHHRGLGVVPFHHAHGFANSLMVCLLNGAPLVVVARFLPRHTLELIERHEVTFVPGSPFIFTALLDCLGDEPALGSVRLALSSGAAMPEGLASRFLERTGVRVLELYGSSETGAIAIEDPLAEPGATTGRPLAHVGVRILGADGNEAAPGTSGEVAVRTPSQAPRYEGEADGGDMNLSPDGFWPTGDLGHFDERGHLVLEGRLSRRLNVAGVKVDPVEIETVVASMPGVAAVRVSSELGSRGLETIKVTVVPEAGAVVDREAVLRHCRTRLAEYKLPRHVELVDALPENLLGKSVSR
jgi:long-chain acyl-CoA synthetase